MVYYIIGSSDDNICWDERFDEINVIGICFLTEEEDWILHHESDGGKELLQSTLFVSCFVGFLEGEPFLCVLETISNDSCDVFYEIVSDSANMGDLLLIIDIFEFIQFVGWWGDCGWEEF